MKDDDLKLGAKIEFKDYRGRRIKYTIGELAIVSGQSPVVYFQVEFDNEVHNCRCDVPRLVEFLNQRKAELVS